MGIPDITPELLAQYNFAVKFLNLKKKCKEHGITKEYVYRVLRGEHVVITKMAKAVQVLAEALSEYNGARAVIIKTIQNASNVEAL